MNPRWFWQQLSGHVAGTLPPPAPDDHAGRLIYGLAQPLLALRRIRRDRVLLDASLLPAMLLAVFCAVVAIVHPEGGFLRSFYSTFVLLAPVPSILLANRYAQLAALAHERLGLGPCRPRHEPLLRSLSHAIKQTAVVAIAVAPLFKLLGVVPALGHVAVLGAAAIWALHWIVVEAFDSARTLPPEGAPAVEGPAPAPWFVRPLFHVSPHLPGGVRWAVHRFARLCSWLSRPWHEEIALTEQHTALVLGFSLTTAAVLAIPVLNLLFRPIIIVAAVHIIGHVRQISSVGRADPAVGPQPVQGVPGEGAVV